MKVLALTFPGFTFIDLAGPMQAFMMLPGFSSQVVWQTRALSIPTNEKNVRILPTTLEVVCRLNADTGARQ